jgi:hypothetical protein
MIQTTTLVAIGMVEIVVLNINLIGISTVLNVNVLIQMDCNCLTSRFRMIFFAMMLFLLLFFWHNCKLAEIKD